MSQTFYASEVREIPNIVKPTMDFYVTITITILLPIYECVITLDRAMSTVWLQKSFGRKELLLLMARGCMVMLALVASLPVTEMSCKPIAITTACLEMVAVVEVAVFAACRAFSLGHRNVLLFLVVAVLGVTPVVTNSATTASNVYRFEAGSCIALTRLSVRTNNIFKFMTHVPVITADIIVIVMTWIRTFNIVLNAPKLKLNCPVSRCFFKNGTTDFLTLLALNLLELITKRTFCEYVVEKLNVTIPLILVNRFILDLCQASKVIDGENLGDVDSDDLYDLRFKSGTHFGEIPMDDTARAENGALEVKMDQSELEVKMDQSELEAKMDKALTSSIGGVAEVYQMEEFTGSDIRVILAYEDLVSMP